MLLLNIVNDILALSQIENLSLSIVISKFDLIEMVEETLNIFRTKQENRKVKLHSRYDKNIPKFFYSDKNRLKQILINLVSNALKYTQEGTVTVKLTMITDGIKFSVTDTGLGIK